MSILSNIKARAKSARLKTKAIAAGFTLGIASIAAIATIGGAAAAPVSTPDCDANAVMWCGAPSVSKLQSNYKNGDGHNKAYTIQDIYNGFGINSSDISGMGSDVTTGYVTKTGDVYAGSTLVATSAMTAGRENIKGSTTKKYGATTYYERSPSVSFQNSELSAMVVMKNGIFQYAILNSCGNPVTGTPKKPAISVQKQVRAAGTSSYGSNVTVKSGSEVQYQITVSSDGQVPAENFHVSDALPSDITYTSGSMDINGKAVLASNVSQFFSKDGLNLGTVTNGTKDVFTFNATAGKESADSTSCKAESLNNYGYIWATDLAVQNSHAGVTTTCTPPQPKPSTLACTALAAELGTAASNGDVPVTLKATASESNATITKYVFTPGDNSAPVTVNSGSTSASVTHTYAPGTYTATVVVSGNDSTGKPITAAANQKCSTTVTIKVPVSNLTCDALGLVLGDTDATTGDTGYTFTGSASASNATIESYVFNFGDGKSTTVSSNNSSATASHTYAPGTYTATVTVSGKDYAGKPITAAASTKCSVQIKVATPDCKPGVPMGSPQCSPSSLACVGLSDVPGDVDATTGDQLFTFTGQASADNGTIESYAIDFGDGKSTTVNSNNKSVTTTHTYAPGTYTATLTVAGKDAAGNVITAPVSTKCSTPIKVAAPQCKPGVMAGSNECYTYTCNYFTITVNNATRTAAVATFNATTTNPNAALTNVVIDWGDNNSNTVTASQATSQSHVFTANSSTITATAQFTVNGQTTPVTSTSCSQPVSFTTPTPPTTPPTTLPNTGAGDVIGIFVGSVVAGTVAFRVFLSRKLARR